MTVKTIRTWAWIHKWTSLICTVFLLMLCITGLPLIFHHEIDELLHQQIAASRAGDGSARADLDAVVASAISRFPGQAVHFLVWDRDDPDAMLVSIGRTLTDDFSNNRTVRVDANNAAYLDAPDVNLRFTTIMLKLHTEIFAGLPGKLFLGLMGVLFCTAIVSGVVVYAPSMRKLRFGSYRKSRPRIVRWLDVHNMAGVMLVTWTLVVGFTGVLNSWADLILKIWQFGQLAEMTAQYQGRETPRVLRPVQAAVDVARRTIPEMEPSFVAFPGTAFTSKSHYAVFMRGNTPVTSRLLKPALVDASTGELTDSRDLPWYVSTLLLSQPLHFGDYGGMPLKIIWALLDILTIVVLVTGIYLWIWRRRAGAAVERIIVDPVSAGTKVAT